MTKLEQLINELCPSEMEYKRFDEMCDIITKQTGFDYTNAIKASLIREKTPNSLPYIQTKFFAGKTFDYETDYYIPIDIAENYPKILLDRKCILFSIVGASIGNVGLFSGEHKAFLGGAICVAKPKREYNIDFLYYYLTSHQGQKQIFRKIKGAGQATVTIEDIREFQIPVPPLEIQNEIVRILDNFTELIYELENELTARKKQYEYYRDLLLNLGIHSGASECEWRTLEEIFDIRNGYTPSKSNADYWENGTIPWFRLEDIRENGRILSDAMQKVTIEAVKNKPFPANSIIISTSATIGEHALITVDFMSNQRFICLTLKREHQDKYDMMFVFYYCFLLSKYCLENLNQSSFASVDMTKFNKFAFPLPPLKEQIRIVNILDRFDKLCNDISEGLPAEIEARRKQYEYYRDKLLTFKEMS